MAQGDLGWMHDELLLKHRDWLKRLTEARASEDWKGVGWVLEDIRLCEENEQKGMKRLRTLIRAVRKNNDELAEMIGVTQHG